MLKVSNLRRENYPSKFTGLLVNILLVCFCLGSVLLHASFGRPIWIDEFLHFALGSHQSTVDAWDSISKTVVSFNHGQTGTYMIVNYWLLQLFGASSFWLRFPSLIAGFLTFLSSLYLFRLWSMPVLWQFIGILALFCQSTLMYFVGEARPYMPLVAATVGILTYYSTPLLKRKEPRIACLGLFSIGVGTLFHPYFSLYWLSICIFTYLHQLNETQRKLSIATFVAHCNLAFSGIGIFLYFSLGYFTWLRGRPDFSFDPFEWIRSNGLVKTFFNLSHLQFLEGVIYPFLGILLSILILVLIVPRARQRLAATLIPPIALLGISFTISGLLSLASLLQDYWILPRQWAASIALSTLAIVWFAQRLSAILGQFHKLANVAWLIIFFTPILINAHKVFSVQIANLLAEPAAVEQQITTGSEQADKIPTNNDEWVVLANANIKAGGQVWPIFRAFYGKAFE